MPETKKDRKMAWRQHKALGISLLIVFVVACIAVCVITRVTHKGTPIDETTFHDPTLRSYVSDKVDMDGDGVLSVEEAAKLVSIRIGGVKELSGLRVFPNLQSIYDSDESLEVADLVGCRSLRVVNFAGAKNLTSLELGKNDSLAELFIRRTGITSLDLAGAGSLAILQCDTDVRVDNAPTLKAQCVDSYVVQETPTDGSSTSTKVTASYDDEGRLERRTIKGGVQAKIEYTYDEFGRPTCVVVASPDQPYDNDWSISYGENGLDMHATGKNNTYVDKTYDELGRVSALFVHAYGLSGEVTESLTYQYDVSGLLSAVQVTDANGDSVVYTAAYNGEGMLVSLSSPESAYTFSGDRYSAGRGNDYDAVAAPIAEQHGAKALLRDFRALNHNTRAMTQLTEVTYDAEDNVLAKSLGTYAYTSDGVMQHGNVSAGNNTIQRTFDVKAHKADVPMCAYQNPVSAVSFRYLVCPEIAIDYWLMGTPERLLDREVEDIVMSQDVSEAVAWNSEFYDDDNYNGTEDDYKAQLPEIVGSDQYAFVDLDGDDSVELVQSPSGRADDVTAIYTLVDGSPRLCRQAADGESIAMSGGGFLKVEMSDGSIQLEHFNGLTFDVIGSFNAETDEGRQIAEMYLPMSGLDWHGVKEDEG